MSRQSVQVKQHATQTTRHVQTDDRARIAALERRIDELERLVRASIPLRQKKQPRHQIELVEFEEFANRHGVSHVDAHRGITIGSLHPTLQDGKHMLDAHNQRTFWELNHDYGPWWRDCPDCPHAE
jgi:hypothetical protein